MVCVVELDTITIDKADGRVRTEDGSGESIQEILSNLKIRILLTICFACLRSSGLPFHGPIASTTRSRLIVHLLRLSIWLEHLVRRPLS